MSQNSITFVRAHHDGSAHINDFFLNKQKYDEYKEEVDKSRKLTAIAVIFSIFCLLHHQICYHLYNGNVARTFLKQILYVC